VPASGSINRPVLTAIVCAKHWPANKQKTMYPRLRFMALLKKIEFTRKNENQELRTDFSDRFI